MRNAILAAVLLTTTLPVAAEELIVPRVFSGKLVVRSFDAHRVLVAIDSPEAAKDEIFLYQGVAPAGVSLDWSDPAGRVIETSRGFVAISPAQRTALVVSLVDDADDGVGLGGDGSGYDVIRLSHATGIKHVRGYELRLPGRAVAATKMRVAAEDDEECPNCYPLNDDWGLNGGGNSALCTAGGAGSTSCSYTCTNGTSCSASCAGGKYSCCWCQNGNATCRCL